MTNEMPYNAWMVPPPTEIPSYVWSKKYDPKPLKIKSSKLIEIKVEEFYHPSKEVALKAAKMAVREKRGCISARWKMGKGFMSTGMGRWFRDIGWNLSIDRFDLTLKANNQV